MGPLIPEALSHSGAPPSLRAALAGEGVLNEETAILDSWLASLEYTYPVGWTGSPAHPSVMMRMTSSSGILTGPVRSQSGFLT